MRTVSYVLLVSSALGCLTCSNEAEMPPKYHVGLLARPTDLEARADSEGVVYVRWRMDSREDLKGFVVSFTDSVGAVENRFVADPEATSFTDSTLGLGHGVYIVRVWAVDEEEFSGPPSEPDTLFVP